MTEQMQDHFEKLVEVDGMLEELELIAGLKKVEVLRDARQILVIVTDLLREDYGKMARARDAAVGLLVRLQAQVPAAVQASSYRIVLLDTERKRITQVIALLQGGEDDV